MYSFFFFLKTLRSKKSSTKTLNMGHTIASSVSSLFHTLAINAFNLFRALVYRQICDVLVHLPASPMKDSHILDILSPTASPRPIFHFTSPFLLSSTTTLIYLFPRDIQKGT